MLDFDRLPSHAFLFTSKTATLQGGQILNISGATKKTLVGNRSVTYYVPNITAKEDAYLVDFISQFIRYPIEELSKSKGRFTVSFYKFFSLVLSRMFRWLNLNKTIIIDYQPFSTSYSCPGFSYRELNAEVLEYFRSKYPDFAYVIKGYNDLEDSFLVNVIEELSFSRVFSRKIYLLDLRAGKLKMKRPLKQDSNRWNKQEKYVWKSIDYYKSEELKKCIQLYNYIYLEKHSRLNPRYTTSFLKSILKNGILEGEVMMNKIDQEIVAVQLYYRSKTTITTPFIGYNKFLPKEERIYPSLNVRLTEIALKEKRILNMSSGAGKFKLQRGGVGHSEYLLCDFRHLGFKQQVAWRIIRFFSNKIAQPYMMKSDI